MESEEKESRRKKNFVRNRLDHKPLFGQFISPKLLATEQKDAKNQKEKQEKDDRSFESDKLDPSSLIKSNADTAIIRFLKKVKKFQDSAWKKNPIKAKSKPRLVYGLREIRKQLLLETVQCVILARDIEIEKTKLATKVDTIREICASNHINILWISSKHDLAKAVDKWPIVSAIAILDYRGAEDAYSEAMHTLTNFMACCRIVEHTDQPSLLA
ncbi:Uncharacterized protein BM_BM9300 [Brugia malayi]|uniref:Bm9300 n=1 Tax=Brugia malayi TaxID=6279 RepID=A0A0K0JYT4_BRUMA|nr:Uncharacterized protein BM_BM9300 [Brugia malayi]CRZ23576.1 Bm9300 [Brugia malayi]VIO97111.1 Uncharacterized protein BM_BM9300 [Brugia malayi]